MKFIRYTIIWISANLSIPFWIVGHIHLTLNVYRDIHEILVSAGMNVLVAVGFWMSWLEHKNEKK